MSVSTSGCSGAQLNGSSGRRRRCILRGHTHFKPPPAPPGINPLSWSLINTLLKHHNITNTVISANGRRSILSEASFIKCRISPCTLAQCAAALQPADKQDQWQLIRSWATAGRSPVSLVNGNHSGISQLNQPASHFQYSYINWDVVGTSGFLSVSNTHTDKE